MQSPSNPAPLRDARARQQGVREDTLASTPRRDVWLTRVLAALGRLRGDWAAEAQSLQVRPHRPGRCPPRRGDRHGSRQGGLLVVSASL